MNKLNLKYQVLTTLCLSNIKFKPDELLAATEAMYSYLTVDIDMDDERSGSVTQLHEVH